jgi:UDP:flavonoid glycosyltransferase YjiC (YdhE family)
VVGFWNLSGSGQTNYKPPEELEAFLAAGPPPIYIGFGSVVVDDPASLTKMLFEATMLSGVRAIISEVTTPPFS